MSNYRRANLVFNSFRSRSRLFTSRVVSNDVTASPVWRLSTLHWPLPSNKPNFRGFFSSLIRSGSHVGRRIIKTAQSSTSPFLGGANRYNLPRPANRKRLYVLSFVGSVVVIVLCFGKFETIPFSNRTHFVIFGPNWDKKLGDWMMEDDEEKLKGKILPGTHPQTIRVRRIANRLIEALQREILSLQVQKDRNKGSKVVATTHLDSVKWEILVVEDPKLLVYLAPGSAIVLSTGLLHHFERDEEIATLIGHEVAHDVARHIAETLTNPMLVLTVVRSSLHKFFEYDSDDYYFPKLTIFWFSHFQRMQMEADYIGMLLLASAGYDPRVAPDVYTKLYKLSGHDPNKKNCFSKHPSGKEKVENLAQTHVMEEALSRYWNVQAEFEDVNKEETCSTHSTQTMTSGFIKH